MMSQERVRVFGMMSQHFSVKLLDCKSPVYVRMKAFILAVNQR